MRAYSIPVILSVLFLFFVSCIQAVEVRAEIWRKKRDDGSYHYVYAMYDVHTECLIDNLAPEVVQKVVNLVREQRKNIIEKFQRLNPASATVLIEDPFFYADGTLVEPAEWRRISDKLSGGSPELLKGLFYILWAEGKLPVINVECRQKKVLVSRYNMTMQTVSQLELVTAVPEFLASLGDGPLKQLKLFQDAGLTRAALFKLESDMNFKMGDLLNEFDTAVKTVREYQDGPILSEYYQRQLNRITTYSKNFVQNLRVSKDKVWQQVVMELGDLSKQLAFGIGFLYYDGTILDMNALHAIQQSYQQGRQKVLLMAGAGHVSNISDVLPSLSYELVYQTGMSKDRIARVAADMTDNNGNIDALMNMDMQKILDLQNLIKDHELFLIKAVQKRVVLSSEFFDLMLSDNPESGWQPGHGAIQ